jgi:hypothetical protein
VAYKLTINIQNNRFHSWRLQIGVARLADESRVEVLSADVWKHQPVDGEVGLVMLKGVVNQRVLQKPFHLRSGTACGSIQTQALVSNAQ